MSSSSTATASSGGIGLFGFVFLVFLFLKLAGIGVVATWSWWWVTAPLWLPTIAVLGIAVIIGVFGLLAALVGAILGGTANRKVRHFYKD